MDKEKNVNRIHRAVFCVTMLLMISRVTAQDLDSLITVRQGRSITFNHPDPLLTGQAN